MKKLFVVVAVSVLFFSFIGAKESKISFHELSKKIAVPNDLKNFVKKELPALISVKDRAINGKILGTNEISGVKIHKIEWSYGGIPVVGRYSVIKERNGEIFSVINALEDFSVDTNPTLSPLEAAKTVSLQNSGSISISPDFISQLVIIERFGKYRLAHKVRFRPTSILDGRFYYVDAHSGEYLGGGNFVMSASENTAKVFDTNPVRDKATEVELPWVADDAEGKLTAEIDEEGIRKVVACNCLDLGDSFEYYGSKYPICTPTQRANKIENGNFVYEDWNKGISYTFDADDNYSEVAVYWHITKIYNYLLSLGLKNFSHLGTHRQSGSLNPIIGVGNFQMPENSVKLSPMDNAFYSPHDPYFKDMFFKDFEYEGDIIVLGQGTKADFAYDGDVIYHEFGHATIEGTAKLSYMAFPDKYGYSNETLGLNEGMADTFSFLVAGDPCLGEYVSEAYGKMYGYEKTGDYYCLRHAENEEIVNESFIGESHHDGLPAVSTHWLMYQAALKKGFTKDDFARYFMSSLLSIVFSDLNYGGWGDILLKTAANGEFASLEEEFRQILEEKGFFSEIRARNVLNRVDYLFSGGVAQYQGMPANTLKIEMDGIPVEVGPMYVQLYYDVPECVDTLTITGMAANSQSMSGAKPKFNLLVRKDKPIIWDVDVAPATVQYDSYVAEQGGWVVKKLESGKRYYMQFINTGPEGLLYSPKAVGSWSSSKECVVDDIEEETDGENSDDDTTLEDDDEITDVNPEKKESKGCSLSFI
ncbi:MAG: hypothetical protein ACOX2F_11045 [bacterium]